MRHQLSELIREHRRLLERLEAAYNSLDAIDYKDNYNYIVEEGCKYMGIKRDDLKKGTGIDSEKRMMIVRAVRQFTDTPLRVLKKEWDYAVKKGLSKTEGLSEDAFKTIKEERAFGS